VKAPLGAFTVLGRTIVISIVHTGVDRAFGYGLKYPSGFKDTHLQRV
jgi:hypothetical protein